MKTNELLRALSGNLEACARSKASQVAGLSQNDSWHALMVLRDALLQTARDIEESSEPATQPVKE